MRPSLRSGPRERRRPLPGPRTARRVREQGPRGRHLAFFGCLYYAAAMRPTEAAGLCLSQCHLPETGWGMLPCDNDSRPVPIPPHFVRLLRQHITAHGTASDGWLITVLHKVHATVHEQPRERASSRIDAALREWNEPK